MILCHFLVCLEELRFGNDVEYAYNDAVASEDLRACLNGSTGDELECDGNDGFNSWFFNDIVAAQSHYIEGDSVPHRVLVTDLCELDMEKLVCDAADATEIHEVAISYNIRDDFSYPYGFLTTFSRTQTLADPCEGPPSICASGVTHTFDIPTPEENVIINGESQPETYFDDFFTASEKKFTIFGEAGGTVEITDISYDDPGDLTIEDSQATIRIKFKTDRDTAVLTWGAWLADRNIFTNLDTAAQSSGSLAAFVTEIDEITGNPPDSVPENVRVRTDAVSPPSGNFRIIGVTDALGLGDSAMGEELILIVACESSNVRSPGSS